MHTPDSIIWLLIAGLSFSGAVFFIGLILLAIGVTEAVLSAGAFLFAVFFALLLLVFAYDSVMEALGK